MKIGTLTTFDVRSVATATQRREAQEEVSTETSVSSNPLAKQIKDWQDAQSQLQALAALRSSPKQAALEKAAMLRQRLEMLKAMLQFATPGMAKALAQELKNIASQLSALGQGAGSSSLSANTATSVTINVDVNTATADESAIATSQASADPSETPVVAEGAADSADSATTSTSPASGSDAEKANASVSGQTSSDSENNALRKTLQDIRKLLQEVIHRVKALMREGDKESKRDLKSAEDSLAALDNALSQGDGNSLYTAQGNFSTAFADVGASLPSATSGGSVDVSA